MEVKRGVEIHHDGDLPARSGIGSSSSFTVGLLHALYALKGKMPTQRELALQAIHIEQEVLKENVGSQDQVLAAFGGFNLIEFGGPGVFRVSPVTISPQRLKLFQDHLMLFYTGLPRTASEVAAEQIKKTPHKQKELKRMLGMLHRALDILNGNGDLSEFGKLLNESWRIKRSLSSKITNPKIDDIYSAALSCGALGGKLLGAGGGGFMLIFSRPQDKNKIRRKLKGLLYVPFQFETLGSQIIFYSYRDSLGSTA
jgi:D-glycero-alpha-D-manno-heptose-7-phosphate kinase